VNVAYYGTSEFGADVLERLVQRGNLDIKTVVSQPDRPSGRGRKLASPPVAERARSLGLTLFQPESASAEPAPADAGLVVAFGQIIRDPLLSAYPLVNLHPSLLPRWRGAAPVERAIMAGDAETGVAAIVVAPELDAGAILGEQRFPIGERDDAAAVRARALELGVPLLERALLERPQPREQATDGLTYARKIEAADRRLDWTRPAVELDRVVRALSPHIGARCTLDGTPMVVWSAQPHPSGPAPGEIDPPLVVGCGEGALELLDVQPAGKRRMPAADFLRGLREPPRSAT
jgi:methionyl-tRNA formyltransferase